MTKLMLGVLAGVFVGAFALEVLNRSNPELLKGLSQRAKLAAGDFQRAFLEGYHGEAPRQETA